MGNEAIVKGLVDMRKYWDALEGDFRVEVSSEDGEDEKKGRTHSVNHGVSAALADIEPGIIRRELRAERVRVQQCSARICSFRPVLSVHRARPRIQVTYQPPRVLYAMLKYSQLEGCLLWLSPVGQLKSI